jgi:hypothetical protein
MIAIDIPAAMVCVEPDCTARLTVQLCLNQTGGFGVKLPDNHGWQVMQQGVFICHCPKHKTPVLATPSIMDIKRVNGQKDN